MPLYEGFIVLRQEGEYKDKKKVLKVIDLEGVESWEIVDDNITKVVMDSGDTFLAVINHNYFGEIVLGAIDGYGKLFMFNEN